MPKKKRRASNPHAIGACGVTVGQDMDGNYVSVCDRVELHPGHDLWMRGARFGEIRRYNTDGSILVKMDNRRVRRLQRMHPRDVKKTR